MKRILHFATAATLLATALPALAQQDVPPPPMPPGQQLGGSMGQDHQARFEQRKAQIITHLQQREQMIAQAISCLQQAQDPQAARACRPRPPERGPRGGNWRGGPPGAPGPQQ